MKTLEPINIAKLLKPYPGKWVALNQEETKVLATGTSIEAVVAEAQKKGEKRPIVIKSPDQYSACFL